jgi:hypothetical protein
VLIHGDGGITVQALYNLGARKMLVFDLGPIGCFPLVHNKIEGKVSCLKELNTMITMFNGKLYYMLMDLTSLLDGTTFSCRTNLQAYLRHDLKSFYIR